MQQQDNNAPEETVGGTTSKATRRGFLKAAAVTTGGVLAGGLAAAGEAKAAPASAAKPAPGGPIVSASGVPVPKADPIKMEAGKFPKGAVMATGRAIGANDRINVAFVGVGGMGGSHVGNYVREYEARNIRVGGICDVYGPRREQRVKVAKDKMAATDDIMSEKDYRKLLDNKNIDAIVVATPEHWHAQVACHAMDAGKHVYIQKPMTRYLDEAFQVHDTAVRTGRVVQIGSQGCSDMRFHAAAKAIQAGRIGQIVRVEDSYTREVSQGGKSPSGEWNYGIPNDLNPDTFDWRLWLGSAPERAWDFQGGANEHDQVMRADAGARFSRYRKFTDYSAGILGDLMPHRLHPLMLASGNPEYPTRVTAIGTQILKDREVPDTVQVIAEFPSNWTMLFIGSTINEKGLNRVIHGTKANLLLSGQPEIQTERPYSEDVENGVLTVEGPGFETHENHEKNWLDCIRTGKTPNCNIDLATKVQTVISLAEMSIRTGKTMNFDAKTRKVSAA